MLHLCRGVCVFSIDSRLGNKTVINCCPSEVEKTMENCCCLPKASDKFPRSSPRKRSSPLECTSEQQF